MSTTNIENVPSRRACSPKTLFLLGGYTDKSRLAHRPEGGEGDGLYSVLFDPNHGKMTAMRTTKVETNPAFIMKHPSLDLVYLTTEVINDSGSEVLTGKLDRQTGAVAIIDRKQVHGRSTCHLEWDTDRSHIIAVSYWDSKLTSFAVGPDGRLSEALQVYSHPGAGYVDEANPDWREHLAHRQRWPHLHQVNRDPFSEKIFLVPDLGQDQIQYFKIREGQVQHLGGDQLVAGGGPRHMEFNVQQRVVYVCGELNNTITVLRYNSDVLGDVLQGDYRGDVCSTSEPSLLKQHQVISTVPQNITCKSTVAEMRLHPSGKFIFVGNRGHNSIAVFRVDPSDGSLQLVSIQASGGAFPRHFNFDMTEQFLMVGNHASDTVVAFRILDTGELEMTDKMEDLPSIVWVTPINHHE